MALQKPSLLNLILFYQFDRFMIFSLSHFKDVYASLKVSSEMNWNISVFFLKLFDLSAKGIIYSKNYAFVSCSFEVNIEFITTWIGECFYIKWKNFTRCRFR